MKSPFGRDFKNCAEEGYLTGQGAEDRAAGIDAQTLALVMGRGQRLSSRLRSQEIKNQYLDLKWEADFSGKYCSYTGKQGKRMKPKKTEHEPQRGLFWVGLSLLENASLAHPLVKLGGQINWTAFEWRLAPTYHDKAGAPGLNTRLMVALH